MTTLSDQQLEMSVCRQVGTAGTIMPRLRFKAKLNLAIPKNHDNSLEREIRSTCNTHVMLCIAPHDS